MKKFKAEIYKTGINACVDVPVSVTNNFEVTKGYIKIKGTINGFDFRTTLVPVKNKPYRLFVNIPMLKGAETSVSKQALFSIEADTDISEQIYPMPTSLLQQLRSKKLLVAFNKQTASRKKDILKYINSIKTAETLQKNTNKVITQLENRVKNVRIP